MLKIRSWAKWQGDALYDRMRKRTPSGRSKPIALAYIAISANMDDESGHFEHFAQAVGGGIAARGYLLAILGHVARDAATSGVVRCSREQLGRILTDRLTVVSRRQGELVYDALVSSGIATEISPDDIRDIDGPSSPPSSPPGSPEASPPTSPPSGRHLPGAEERRGEERRKTKTPPTPREARSAATPTATAGGSASPPTNGHDSLSPRPPTPQQIAGVKAGCAVLVHGKDVPQDKRDDAKRMIQALEMHDASAQDVENFARRHYSRTDFRVAYLNPP